MLLSANAKIGTDLLAAGANVDIKGNVARDIRVAGSNITISGIVGRNVYVKGGERLTITDGAVIKGSLYYESRNKAQIAPGAKILGEVRQTIPKKEARAPIFWSGFAWWFWSLLASILFGIVLLLLFPARSQIAADTARNSFWASLLVGIITLIVVPIACIIVAITILGIPLALVIFAIYLILLYAAKIFVALMIGKWILSRGRDITPNPFGAMILGLVMIWIVELLPFIGWLVKFVVLITGLGAFLLSWWRDRTLRPVTATEPPTPPAPIGGGPAQVGPGE